MVFWTMPLVAAVANVLLAILVARAPVRTELTRVFIFLSMMFALWNLNFFSLFFFDDYDSAAYATQVFRLGAAFMPAAAFHLVVSLRDRPSRAWTYGMWINYGVAVYLCIANMTGDFVVGLNRFDWGYYSIPGPAYNVFTFYLTTNLVLAVVVLVADYHRTEDAYVRLQLRFWLLGALPAITLGLTNLLPAYGYQTYPLGNLGSTAWAAVVAYAIARHRLIDTDVIVTKSAAFAIAGFAILVPVFLLVLWSQWVSIGTIDRDLSFIILLSLVAVALTFPRLLARLEPELYASLFPEKREYRLALMSFTHSVTRILDRDMLIRELAANLSRNLRPTSVLVAASEEHPRALRATHSIGVAPSSKRFETDPTFLQFVAELPRPLLLPELRDSPIASKFRWIEDEFKANRWEVCIPLRVGKRVLGFIALGTRSGLDAYAVQDLEILEALGAEASIALENSRLYAELQQSQDIIRRADRSSALGILAAGIAHEIRNPLVSIQTFFQLAPDRLQDEEFVTTFLQTAAGEVRRISELINELLSFARSPNTEFSETNLNDVVQGACVLLSAEAKKHRLRLIQNLPEQPVVVWGNFEQIRQVLINLIFNAIQASDIGGTIQVAVRKMNFQDHGFGQIEVRDEGAGIANEHLNCLFDPFFTTKATGTGLGLAIVQRIVSEHNGRITVSSDVGKGSCFFVEIPTSGFEIDAHVDGHARMSPSTLKECD